MHTPTIVTEKDLSGPVGGVDERVHRTAAEQAQFDADCRAAAERQLLRSLQNVADNGGTGEGYFGGSNDGHILTMLKSKGWLDLEVVKNPAGDRLSGVKDRMVWTLTVAGKTRLEEANGSG
jgi:hypothetical protein